MLALAAQGSEALANTGESSIDLGSVLIAAAAAFAALLAAISASVRQRAQLQHDRELREREHIRDTLDSQVGEVQQSLRVLMRFRASVSTFEEPYHRELAREVPSREEGRSKAQDKDAPGSEQQGDIVKRWRDARRASHEALLKRRAGTTRLRLRLGRRAAITKHHDQFVDGYSKLHRSLGPPLDEPRSSEEKADEDAAYEEMKQAYQDFLRACERWFDEGSGLGRRRMA